MSVHMLYALRESLKGMRRTKTATMTTISTIAVSLSMFGILLIITLNLHRVISLARDQMIIEVFIDNTLEEDKIFLLGKEIESLNSIMQAEFVSKEKALEKFQAELGEDPIELLGYNPLPASYQIKIYEQYHSQNELEKVADQLESLPGVDEVKYRGGVYDIINRYSRYLYIINILLCVLSFSAAVFMVINTIRLTILAQQNSIQIMELVGAKQSFIRLPYIIQGILEGALGGIASLIILWLAVSLISLRFPHLLSVVSWVYWFPLVIGILLSFGGTQIALYRFLNR